MHSVDMLFHSPPSTEFTTPRLEGLQHVWKRVFEHVVDRGDMYKRIAFNNMHDTSKELDEGVYADLRFAHDLYIDHFLLVLRKLTREFIWQA